MSVTIRCFACCALAVLGAGPGQAGETLAGPYLAEVERVVDGDTLRARVSVWLGQHIEVLVRIRGIDAPEVHGRCESETERARLATEALQQLVAGGAVVLTGIEGGKYFGRVVADVATPEGADVGAALIAAGHARAYDGGTRGSWCDVGTGETNGAALALGLGAE